MDDVFLESAVLILFTWDRTLDCPCNMFLIDLIGIKREKFVPEGIIFLIGWWWVSLDQGWEKVKKSQIIKLLTC